MHKLQHRAFTSKIFCWKYEEPKFLALDILSNLNRKEQPHGGSANCLASFDKDEYFGIQNFKQNKKQYTVENTKLQVILKDQNTNN
jgi:hypothetical protein